MKTRILTAALSLAFCIAQGSASAALFFADGFDYANGELTVNDGTGDDVSGGLWAPHSGETFDDNIDVIDGQAELLNSGSEDANRLAGAMMTFGDTWYYAALVTVNDTRANSADPINNDYFIHFKDAAFGFRGRTYVSDPNAADPNKFTFGLSATSGGQVAQWADDLEFGTEYLVVTSYSFDTGESNLWVNPTDMSSTKITDVNGGGAGTEINSLGIRQDFIGGTPNNQILLDAVSLASTFDEAVAGVIPEPSTVALSVLGLCGLIGFHRRGC